MSVKYHELDMKALGRELRLLREEHGLSRKELAKLSGVNEKRIERWENGCGLGQVARYIAATENMKRKNRQVDAWA